jgi:hypothetical protein
LREGMDDEVDDEALQELLNNIFYYKNWDNHVAIR